MAHAVPIAAGDSVQARMPSPAESETYHFDRNVPILEIRRRNGTTSLYSTHPSGIVFMATNPERCGTSGAAVRRQIVDDVRQALVVGGLRGGDRLPTVEQLMDAYDTTMTTVRRALDEIRQLGLAEPEQGDEQVVRT